MGEKRFCYVAVSWTLRGEVSAGVSAVVAAMHSLCNRLEDDDPYDSEVVVVYPGDWEAISAAIADAVVRGWTIGYHRPGKVLLATAFEPGPLDRFPLLAAMPRG